ncbi:MAG: sulfurtransferase TusA family protein [Nitrosomonas sp.]|jgi:tRNA 2-thiouridine synthesizing protein A
MDFDKELNVSGLLCPLPILRTKQSLSAMSSGQLLKVITTDPASIIDFQVFSDNTGNELLSISETDSIFTFFLKKK